MENNRPEYLYRGICIRYDELKDFVFSGIDIELPYDPYIDSQGKEIRHDGNEYGIYMSDNPKVAEYAYGNATNEGNGTYIEPKVTIGNRGTEFIKIPAIGVCYKISTQGLDIRKPLITSALQGVYNNGFNGDEWITDKIPAGNYEIMSVQIGQDLLHDEQYIDLNDIENIKEKVTQILEQRKARLETFAQEMSKFPEQQRKEFGLGHLEILKEIYGENGFYYMGSIEEIDSSSNVGMIRYLMANVYKNNTDSIDFGTLLYLQDIKEIAEFMQKKGKEFDLKEYLTNNSENDSHNEKILEIIKQRKLKILIQMKKSNIIGVTQEQSKGNDKNDINQNYVNEKEEVNCEVIDYYEKYGIDRDEKWEVIKEKLSKEQRKWLRRSGSTYEKERLDEVLQQIDEISEVLALFKPGNEEKRKEYDVMLEQQKKQVGDDAKEKETEKNSKLGLGDILFDEDKLDKPVGVQLGLYVYNKERGQLKPLIDKNREILSSFGDKVNITSEYGKTRTYSELGTHSYSGLNLTYYRNDLGEMCIARNENGELKQIETETLDKHQEIEKEKERISKLNIGGGNTRKKENEQQGYESSNQQTNASSHDDKENEKMEFSEPKSAEDMYKNNEEARRKVGEIFRKKMRKSTENIPFWKKEEAEKQEKADRERIEGKRRLF